MNNSSRHFFFCCFLFIGALLLLGGCSAASRQVSNEALQALVVQGRAPVIVDVRSEGEFARGHIPGALHIPFYSVGRRSQEVSQDMDTPVVVYCAHGPRAWWAAKALRRKGFR